MATFKMCTKSSMLREIIGVDFEIFTKWIQFQFDEGMTMENYGSVWYLDHVLPISSFNLLDEEELLEAMNWMNIRPMPSKNMQKLSGLYRELYEIQEEKADDFMKYLDEM